MANVTDSARSKSERVKIPLVCLRESLPPPDEVRELGNISFSPFSVCKERSVGRPKKEMSSEASYSLEMQLENGSNCSNTKFKVLDRSYAVTQDFVRMPQHLKLELRISATRRYFTIPWREKILSAPAGAKLCRMFSIIHFFIDHLTSHRFTCTKSD